MKIQLKFIFSAILLLGASLELGAQATPPARGKAAPAAQPWPRTLDRDGMKVVYYQPQIDAWTNQRVLNARMAFLVTPKGGKATPGIAVLTGNTMVDMTARTVFIDKVSIDSLTFPSASAGEVTTLTAAMKKEFPGKALTISLDHLMAAMEKVKTENKGVAVQMPVPMIFASAKPAVLLLVPGKPVLAPVVGTRLQFVVNANWTVFYDPVAKLFYLLTGKSWHTAQQIEGPWSIGILPDSVKSLPAAKGMWSDARAAAVAWNPDTNRILPKVFYSAKPAELILFNGEPTYQSIPGTTLQWATNTDSHVFFDAPNKQFYFMVTGRWFRAPNLVGPWTYAGNDLPATFKAIPANDPSASVLASVPGTPDAENAVLLAQVPTTAIVHRSQAEAKTKIIFYGEPVFKSIDGTNLSYATNTSAEVIQDGSNYYLCQDAVWFVSGAAKGPWKVATTVPAEIYKIPPSAPVYNVTYVQQNETSNPETIESSYTAGYSGSYIAGLAAGAALVYGTGYDYSPYVGLLGDVPVYQPWYGTYGYGAAYNWGVGGFGVGGWGYGPYAAAGRAAWYNPATGFYNHAAAVDGPYGGRAIADGYNPRTGTAYATKQGYGPYGSWGTTAATRGDQWVQAGHVSTPYGSAAGYRGSDGEGYARTNASGGVTAAGVHGDNAYAAHDGNVYHRSADGEWSKAGVGAADPGYRPPESTSRELNQAYDTRSTGYNQAANYAHNDGGWTDRTQGMTDAAGRFAGGRGDHPGDGGYGDHFGGGSFGGARSAGRIGGGTDPAAKAAVRGGGGRR